MPTRVLSKDFEFGGKFCKALFRVGWENAPQGDFRSEEVGHCMLPYIRDQILELVNEMIAEYTGLVCLIGSGM